MRHLQNMGKHGMAEAESCQRAKFFDSSMRSSHIYLALVFKADYDDVEFCMRHDLLPPEKIRRKSLRVWLDGARAGIASICFHSRSAFRAQITTGTRNETAAAPFAQTNVVAGISRNGV